MNVGVPFRYALRSPHVPLSPLRVKFSFDADAVPPAQELDLGPLLHGHHVDAMTLVRPDVEALSQDAPHPPVRNGAVILARRSAR